MALPRRQFGQYTGYTRRPDGGFNFQLADGRTMPAPASSQAANDIARRIDSFKPDVGAAPETGPDERLASGAAFLDNPVTGSSPAATDHVPPMRAEGPQQDWQGSVGTASSRRAAKQDEARTRPTVQLPTGAPGQVVRGAAGIPGSIAVDGQGNEWDIGSVGRGGTKSGYRPSAKSETTEQGPSADPEYLAQTKESLEREKSAIETQRDEVARIGEEVRQVRAEAAAEGIKQVQTDEAAAKAGQQAYEAALKREQDSLQAVQDYQVDEKRMFRGAGGTLKAIGAALAVGVGAFGAALARTPNYALDIINRAVDRDIDAQETELEKKKEGANNAIANRVRAGASLDEAKNLFRMSVNRVTDLRLQEKLQQSQNAQEQVKFTQMIEANNRDFLNLQDTQRRIAEGSKKTAESHVYQAGSGPGGPRLLDRGETYAAEGKELDLETKRKELQQGPGGKKTESEKRAEAGLIGGLSAYKRLARAAGAQIDENGHLVGADLSTDLPGGDTEATAEQKAALGVMQVQGGNALNSGAELGQPAREKLGLELEGILPRNRTKAVSSFGEGLYGELRRRGIDPESIK